ncbi:MAG: DUF2461 domain-containing protein [Candidatus Zhuqueibacterota bacterium]
MQLEKSLQFLTQLRSNNDRAWFNANRSLYEEAKIEFEKLIDALIPITKEIDPEIDVASASECTFRIFRDTRFSHDKLPYKTNFGAFVAKGGRKSPYAGYYFHLEPGGSFAGGGIYRPDAKYLAAIRSHIYENTEAFKKIIDSADFKQYFSEIYGDRLKSSPRDFPKDFADIHLLAYKDYAVIHRIDDFEWISEDIMKTLRGLIKIQYPFNRFLNDAVKKVAS